MKAKSRIYPKHMRRPEFSFSFQDIGFNSRVDADVRGGTDHASTSRSESQRHA